MSREYTKRLIELIEEGVMSHKNILNEMLQYFSEKEIKGFCLDSFAGEISREFKDLE